MRYLLVGRAKNKSRDMTGSGLNQVNREARDGSVCLFDMVRLRKARGSSVTSQSGTMALVGLIKASTGLNPPQPVANSHSHHRNEVADANLRISGAETAHYKGSQPQEQVSNKHAYMNENSSVNKGLPSTATTAWWMEGRWRNSFKPEA